MLHPNRSPASRQPRSRRLHSWLWPLAPLALAAAAGAGAALLTERTRCAALSSTRQPSAHPAARLDAAQLDASLRSLASLTNSVTVVSPDSVTYSRYARMYNRRVLLPNATTATEFDIVGRVWRGDSFTVVSVIPFDVVGQTFTMLREFNPATAAAAFTFPQGCVEASKHKSPLDAAHAELEEEARLRCDPSAMIPLLDAPSSQDKYQREVVHYFLCTSSRRVAPSDSNARDKEELLFVERHVTVRHLRGLIRAGVLQSNNIASAFLAMDRLRDLGLLQTAEA
jgi:8-oxo-dGTP pyrophosphatase MutT (NUDIX family)